MKANLQSACFSVRPRWTAMAVRRRIIGIEMTGEKQSAFVQDHCSKLPNTTMRLLALVGTPLVCLMTKMHIDGITQTP